VSAEEPPHFADVPGWAEWLAQDADGSWWAYEACPNQHDSGWYENELGRRQRIETTKRNQDWPESLQRVSRKQS